MPNSSPAFLPDATVPMFPKLEDDWTHVPPSEASVDETYKGFELGENYENSAAPGPVRPASMAVERSNETFALVPGRLALLSASKKYKVTIGEINRRVNGPEAVHTSMLNGILRNGKGKDNGELLRKNLKNYGIELTYGRRKNCKMSLFTSLCEAEARELAEDFNNLCRLKGSVEDLAQEYIQEQINQGVPFSTIASEITAVENFMNFVARHHPADLKPEDLDSTSPAEKSVENLSLLTHGFSHVAISGIARHFGNMASEARKILYRGPETSLPGHRQVSPATQADKTFPFPSPPTFRADCLPPTKATPANSPRHTSQPWEHPPITHYHTPIRMSSHHFYPFYTHPSPFMASNIAHLQSHLMQSTKLEPSDS